MSFFFISPLVSGSVAKNAWICLWSCYQVVLEISSCTSVLKFFLSTPPPLPREHPTPMWLDQCIQSTNSSNAFILESWTQKSTISEIYVKTMWTSGPSGFLTKYEIFVHMKMLGLAYSHDEIFQQANSSIFTICTICITYTFVLMQEHDCISDENDWVHWKSWTWLKIIFNTGTWEKCAIWQNKRHKGRGREKEGDYHLIWNLWYIGKGTGSSPRRQ